MNYKIIILGVLLVLIIFNLHGQSNSEYLKAVEQNNPYLIAAKANLEANKMSAKTGIYPSGLQVEGGYFPGKNEIVKQVFGIRQEFDFPTVYGSLNKIAKSNIRISEEEYHEIRIEVLSQALQMAAKYIYTSKQTKEFALRNERAEKLLRAFENKFNQGEANLLEVNKVKLAAIKAKTLLEDKQQELNSIVSEIAFISGKGNFDLESLVYPAYQEVFDEDFVDKTIGLVPRVRKSELNTEKYHHKLKLQKQSVLPGFSIGYEMEKTDPELFRGVKVGVQIPLWQNKNKTKTARLSIIASENQSAAISENYRTQLTVQLGELTQLNNIYEAYKKALKEIESIELLEKSMELGHISLIEFFMELEYFYEATDRLLEVEYKLALKNIELTKYNY